MGFWDIFKTVAPIGMQLYGMSEQKKMMKDLNKANQKSYDKYLTTINPSADVQASRFNELKSGILERAPGARTGTANRLAARGIRGQGAGAPVAETDDAIQRAINDAYFKIYGQYNVPSQPGPANYAPSFGNLVGSNAGDIGSYLLAKRLSESDWWKTGGKTPGKTATPAANIPQDMWQYSPMWG